MQTKSLDAVQKEAAELKKQLSNLKTDLQKAEDTFQVETPSCHHACPRRIAYSGQFALQYNSCNVLTNWIAAWVDPDHPAPYLHLHSLKMAQGYGRRQTPSRSTVWASVSFKH